MSVSSRHILHQGPVLSALGRTAFLALRQRWQPAANGAPGAQSLPGPEVHRTKPPLPRSLIDDYVRFAGGDPRAYRGEVPPHLFPQWCMPAFARTLEGLAYPLLQVVNGGCRVRVHGALGDREPLDVRARLLDIEDDGRRAVLHQHALTGTSSAPDALEIDLYAIVPSGRANGARSGDGQGSTGPSAKPRARVPEAAREIARRKLGRDAGLSFAKLTGDFNPIHWVQPYARAAGFRDVVLHGFGTLALCWEALDRGLLAGSVHAIQMLDARFTRPLRLPHEVGVYVQDGAVFVGDAPGGPAYLTGQFTARGET